MPDWRRESTLDPRFLMVVVIALFLIAGLGAVSFAYSAKSSAAKELAKVKANQTVIAEDAKELRAIRKQINLWNKALAKLEEKQRKRLILSRQLAELHRVIPDDVVLQGLEFHTEKVDRKVKTANGEQAGKVFRYAMSLSGSASGDDPQAAITLLANRLSPGRDSLIGRTLEDSDLKNMSGGIMGEDKMSFNIVGIYKPAAE